MAEQHCRRRRALPTQRRMCVLVASSFGVPILVLQMTALLQSDAAARRALLAIGTTVSGGSVEHDRPWLMIAKTSVLRNPSAAMDHASMPLHRDDHPYAGARSANHAWGYVADAVLVRRYWSQQYNSLQRGKPKDDISPVSDVSAPTPPPPASWIPWQNEQEFQTICNMSLGSGSEGKVGGAVLAKVVQAHSSSNNNNTHAPTMSRRRHNGKLLCVTYTHHRNHYRVDGLAQTWGKQCDGYLAASDRTVMMIDDHPAAPMTPPPVGLGAVDLPHHGNETYDWMWQKTRSIMGYLAQHYMSDYDYVFVSGDDTHLIVDNLRLLLDELEQTYGTDVPWFTGHWTQGKRHRHYIGGGGGYLLNRAALRALHDSGHLMTCLRYAQGSSEDRFISQCLQEAGAKMLDAADAQGRQRFFGHSVDFIGRFNGQSGFFAQQYKLWAQQHGWKTGVDLISPRSVSFHLLKTPVAMKRHHAILHRSCPRGTRLGDDLATIDSADETAAT